MRALDPISVYRVVWYLPKCTDTLTFNRTNEWLRLVCFWEILVLITKYKRKSNNNTFFGNLIKHVFSLLQRPKARLQNELASWRENGRKSLSLSQSWLPIWQLGHKKVVATTKENVNIARVFVLMLSPSHMPRKSGLYIGNARKCR